MRRAATIVMTGGALAVSTILAVPAHAGPVGGCGKGFELRSVASIQEEAQNTPDAVIAAWDTNGDGNLCSKYTGSGATAHDNSTQHNK